MIASAQHNHKYHNKLTYRQHTGGSNGEYFTVGENTRIAMEGRRDKLLLEIIPGQNPLVLVPIYISL